MATISGMSTKESAFLRQNVLALLLIANTLLISGCGPGSNDYSQPLSTKLDIQGHRGCRGSLPENTIAGFLQALEWGVTTLEMDVVISKDQQVVLSHEPYLSHHICFDELGNGLDSAAKFRYNMYQMTYQEIEKYDCGSKAPPGFPNQQPSPGPKPLLTEVIPTVEAATDELDRPNVRYNIELKSMASFDDILHPGPKKFTELVLKVIKQHGISSRTTIQSFDPRILSEVRQQEPDIAVSYLVGNDADPDLDFIKLGFNPDIYSPHYSTVNDSLIWDLHKNNIAVIPWTVNDTLTMQRLINSGVDGIITDYPELLIELVHN